MVKQLIENILMEDAQPTIAEWWDKFEALYNSFNYNPATNDYADFEPLFHEFIAAFRQAYKGTALGVASSNGDGWLDTASSASGGLRRVSINEYFSEDELAKYKTSIILVQENNAPWLKVTTEFGLKDTGADLTRLVDMPHDAFWFDLQSNQTLADCIPETVKSARGLILSSADKSRHQMKSLPRDGQKALMARYIAVAKVRKQFIR